MINRITLVTGNKNKLAEWQRLLPAEFQLEAADVDLAEIQSLDSREIIADKLARAYAQINKPLVVEDITAGLVKLNGLPGPFIKFFEQRLGKDALFQLAGQAGEAVVVSCTIGYFDGRRQFTVHSEVTGTAVAARGENGFGFDCCFVIDGLAKTYAEMESAEKDRVSHRALAIQKFVTELRRL